MMTKANILIGRSEQRYLSLTECNHLCSSDILAIAEYDIVHIRLLNYTSEKKKQVKGDARN